MRLKTRRGLRDERKAVDGHYWGRKRITHKEERDNKVQASNTEHPISKIGLV